jgi:hypothetical protein
MHHKTNVAIVLEFVAGKNNRRVYTVKTGASCRFDTHYGTETVPRQVSFQHIKGENDLLSVKTTLRLSYRVLEMTLLSALIKSHSKVSKRHSKCHF